MIRIDVAFSLDPRTWVNGCLERVFKRRELAKLRTNLDISEKIISELVERAARVLDEANSLGIELPCLSPPVSSRTWEWRRRPLEWLLKRGELAAHRQDLERMRKNITELSAHIRRVELKIAEWFLQARELVEPTHEIYREITDAWDESDLMILPIPIETVLPSIPTIRWREDVIRQNLRLVRELTVRGYLIER